MERKMTDIHMHLIPGVDDGATDLNMARSMMQRACMQGITKIFATPHSSAFDTNPAKVKQQFEDLQNQTSHFFPGMDENSLDIIQKWHKKAVKTIFFVPFLLFSRTTYGVITFCLLNLLATR